MSTILIEVFYGSSPVLQAKNRITNTLKLMTVHVDHWYYIMVRKLALNFEVFGFNPNAALNSEFRSIFI
jgi:hypothetical protein